MQHNNYSHNTWRGLIPVYLLLCGFVTALEIWGVRNSLRGMRLSEELGRPHLVWWLLIAFLSLCTLAVYLMTAYVFAKAKKFDRGPDHCLSERERRVFLWLLRHVVRFDPDKVTRG